MKTQKSFGSGGRACSLKRTSEVNNYNLILLKLSQANMDVQSCGSNETIALYIANNASKSEPECVTNNIAMPDVRNRTIKFNEFGHTEGFSENTFEHNEIRTLGEAHGYNFNIMSLMTFAMPLNHTIQEEVKALKTILFKMLKKKSHEKLKEK
ncbi:hypothetical protein TNCV_562791 [Trichonephila clavipes]|nr:hypothetical protein TNCV_562791 [Trichonephila clavipes]